MHPAPPQVPPAPMHRFGASLATAMSRAAVLCVVAGVAAWVLLGVAAGWSVLPSHFKDWYRGIRVLRLLDYLAYAAIMAAFLLDLVALAAGHRARWEMRRRRGDRKGDHLVRIGLALGYVNLLVAVGVGLVLLWGIAAFIRSDPDYIPR